MDDLWKLIADQLSDRVSGPMKFRIVLQPVMATFLAVRSGLADAKSGKDPYFWSFLFTPGHRFDIVKDGWKSVGRLFLLAIILDIIYQIFVQSSFHLRAALIVAYRSGDRALRDRAWTGHAYRFRADDSTTGGTWERAPWRKRRKRRVVRAPMTDHLSSTSKARRPRQSADACAAGAHRRRGRRTHRSAVPAGARTGRPLAKRDHCLGARRAICGSAARHRRLCGGGCHCRVDGLPILAGGSGQRHPSCRVGAARGIAARRRFA